MGHHLRAFRDEALILRFLCLVLRAIHPWTRSAPSPDVTAVTANTASAAAPPLPPEPLGP